MCLRALPQGEAEYVAHADRPAQLRRILSLLPRTLPHPCHCSCGACRACLGFHRHSPLTTHRSSQPACASRSEQAVARRKAGELRQRDPSLRFRLGFHAVPSLRQLHMHVISQVGAGCLRAAAGGQVPAARWACCQPGLRPALRMAADPAHGRACLLVCSLSGARRLLPSLQPACLEKR